MGLKYISSKSYNINYSNKVKMAMGKCFFSYMEMWASEIV